MLRRSCLLSTLLFGLLLPALSIGTAGAAKCPNLVIVLDKSGSMAAAPDDSPAPPGGSKFELARAAIKKLLDRYDGQLPIGLSMFASDASCGAGQLIISPDYDTGMQILQKINAAQPDSETPTAETIDGLRKEKVFQDASRDQYMLLITDGGPNCGDSNPPVATVAALSAAHKQNPSITTFVVGFGKLPKTESDALEQMAVAGGKPVMGADHQYYVADSLDSLDAAIDAIFTIIQAEGGAMTCDDTCYSNGCPNPGDFCIRGQCKQNPCASMTCGPGLYCFTDGASPGQCVKACTRQCPRGQRCEMGQCIKDACPAPCIAGFVCNQDDGLCEPDPLCTADRPRKDQCHKPSQCQYGMCADEPCQYIQCPADTRCVPWDGTCAYAPTSHPSPDMALSPGPNLPSPRRGGCNAGSGDAASGFTLAFGLLFLLLVRRRPI